MSDDVRFKYIYRQVVNAFRHISIDKINDYWAQDFPKRVIYEFLDNPEVQAIFFKESKGSIEVSQFPSKVSNKNILFYMVKTEKSQITEKSMTKELIYGDITSDPLEHMAMISQRVFHPIVRSKESGQVWSETIAKEILDSFDTFIANIQITQGHVRGVTCLPLPSAGGPKNDSKVSEQQQQHIHDLEGAIIIWTKQIKNVLKQDPESVFQTHEHPGPMMEVNFWRSKASNLNGIFDQLQSTKVRRVLKILDQSKSTYNGPFAKLCKEVFYARAEANNIVKYLRPLVDWFEGLENETEFQKLPFHFRPILHLILLVWKSSSYYNTPSRLVILMREICNTIIRLASQYLNGDTFLDLIEAGETHTVIRMLQTALTVLGKFKSTYFDYKAKASVECGDNPWRVQNNALFIRLDGFLERCHDVLDLSQTILMFAKLSKIEVGGTKGKTLTTSIAQIYADFTVAVDVVRSVGKGILDTENKAFDEAFYDFRTRMKEMDRRLGSVIIQAFDDATSVSNRFRLLETFDTLITRPVIQDQLEKKHVSLIEAISQEVLEVQQIFLSHKDSPPIANNLPPIAGALTWSRGLSDRISGPIEKLKTLDKKILEREDTKEVIKLFTILIGMLGDYDNDNITNWGRGIEASSQAKLKNPLLRKAHASDASSGTTTPNYEPSLLSVNFDPVLVRLLREVKYFILLGLQVPPSAMEIYQKAEVFRRHTGNLDLIVNMYNDIQTSLLPVERPLVKSQLERIDKTLSQGIGEGKNKSKALNWKSNGIEIYIGEAMTEAKEVTEILQLLKGNLKRVEQIVNFWETQPIFERSSKTSLTDDFITLQHKVRQAKLTAVKEAGQEIHRLIKDTNKKLKVSQGLPDWKSYVDFMNNVVVYGLVDAMTSSLRALAAQLNPKHLESTGLSQLVEIQVDLLDKKVAFIPEVGYVEGGDQSMKVSKLGFKNIVISWFNGMFGLSTAFKRLDFSEGTYIKELTESPTIQIQIGRISKFLDSNEVEANKLRSKFRKFDYLWLTDLHASFEEFLRVAVQKEEVPFANSHENGSGSVEPSTPGTGGGGALPFNSSALDDIGTWTRTTINLDMFGEKISQYLEIQMEVADIRAIYETNFMKINAQPVKQAISTWVTKWLYKYTQYLQEYLAKQLNDLYAFFCDVDKGLGEVVESGDRDALMRVMTNIRDVRRRMPELAALFDPLRSIVLLLKSKSITVDLQNIGGQPALDFLEQSKMRWENTINRAYRVKESIQPLQNSMLEGIRKEIKSFEQTVARFMKEFRSNGPFNWLEPKAHKDAYVQIDRYQKSLGQLQIKSKSLNELEDLFELPLSKHTSIYEVQDDLRTLKGVWDLAVLVESLTSTWNNTLWGEIKTEELLEEIKRIQAQMKRQPKKPREWGVFKQLNLNIKNLNVSLPLVHELRSPAMRDRHWKTLMVVTNTNFEKGPSFCLQDLLALNLHRYVEPVAEIVEIALKELKIEQKLVHIEETWRRFSLKFDRHRDTEVYVVSPPDEILEALEEHHLHLQAMAGMGKSAEFFKEQVVKWQTTLGEVESTLKMLLLVERQWGSLESIFLGSADIRAQLPDDTKRFEGVDAEFKEQMKEIQARPGVIACCTLDGREQSLRAMHKELEKCEKALNEYLEVKKGIFPRFYFVANAALLDILSNGNNPPKIMPHLASVFDGIADLELCYSSNQTKSLKDDPTWNPGPMEAAKSMISKDKEIIHFPAIFEMRAVVENWLNDLVKEMRLTLQGVLNNSMKEADTWDSECPREEWIFSFPAQIAVVTAQIVWTKDVEDALEALEGGQEDAVKKYAETCTIRLEGLIRLVQGELSKGDRVKIITVITIDVHSRDVVLSLLQKRVENASDFKWQSQLRYVWMPTEQIVNIRICDFSGYYAFEYVGNCGRLVITPLTDRCYVTLTVALKLILGGAPAGPAGTGKTETTKDLARGCGLPCYVFNCSDQMTYQTVGDIFKGLTQVGAWGCFDEFNRIVIEVLSVVASQVRCILDALGLLTHPANRQPQFQFLPPGLPQKIGTFDFFGEQIALVPTVGIFITMNPGYAGRTELPENLKALFRSCAMIQPDFLPICENMLMAEGFVNARPLSVKFVTLYKLSSQLLSKQHHYDWGLRAIKSVLCVAGMLRRADPEVNEDAVLMRALRDFNTPKIPSNDIPIFLRLISDLFPGLDLPPKVNLSLHKTCVDVCKQFNLLPEDNFVSKVMQYQELLDVRHSVMLLGPAGCGKTTVWKTLAKCHNFNKPKPVTIYDVVNPKAVTTDELYGYMTLTKDWKDGVLSIIMRNMSKNFSPYTHSQTGKWVVLDGDIDAVWIESMNTVMDDNKMLTLVSNERIPLTESMRMIFEIHSLKNATPATVSRAGILYINDTDISYTPFIESWLLSRSGEFEKPFLPDLFDRYLGKVTEFVTASKLEFIVPLPLINLVQTMCYTLDGLLKSFSGEKTQLAVERLFLYSLMWAFCGPLIRDKQTDGRKAFSGFFRQLVKNVKFPEAGNVLDYFIDPNTGDGIPWTTKVSSFVSNAPESQGATIVVPTADTVRMTHLMDILVRNGKAIMFVGPAGTGKSLLVQDYLASLSASESNFKFASINMNFYTDSLSLQQQLEQHLEKRSGKTFGPPGGRLLYFVDDINLAEVGTYGTQTPIALMRQHIDHGSWFDRVDVSLKKRIADCQYAACMNPKCGSFFINPRLQRHFTTLAYQMPNDENLNTVFSTILNGHFLTFDKKIQNMCKNITDASIALHAEISTKFLPSALKFHYNFTMRDLAAIFKGLLNSRPKEYRLPLQMARLWYHEVIRVYSDRLISEVEVQRCKESVVNIGKKFFEDDPEIMFAEPCSFTHFVTDDGEELSTYMPCEDTSRLKKDLEHKLHNYNENNPIMNLVLFEQAIRHVTRISRILMFPGGNALLVGVGGSGKQSLSKLAAFICQYDITQIAMTSTYSINELKEQLKDMYRKAAVKPGEPLMFLVTDTQITDERFLIYINDLLSSGRIADLYTKEEYDGIFSSLRSIAKSEGVPDNRDSMATFFFNRVKNNLHVVLCFSPVGDTFRQRARKFPGVINCTSIDWFHPWPKDALVSVAQKFLEDIQMTGRTEVKDNIAYHVAEVHESVNQASTDYFKEERRYNYTTPKSFLELISFYKNLLVSRRDEMVANTKRLDTGLLTLKRTNKDVERLQEFLKEKKKEVDAKKAATDSLLEEMGQQRSEAEAQQAIADVEKRKADAMANEAQKLEDQATEDLALATPALQSANDAVRCLDKGSMTELKSFPKPPPGVDKVTTALLIMIKQEKKDFSWENGKKMMAKVDQFKEKLESYNGEDIPEDVIHRVSPLLEDPDFSFERMRSKSAAAANLVNWVVNIIKYNRIYKDVKPKMDALEVAKKDKKRAEDDLAVVNARLATIEARLSNLQSQFTAATQEKARVEQEARDCLDRLSLAERLTNGLASEKERWTHTVEVLKAQEETLPGNVMLAAAFTCYNGAFGANFRTKLWRDVWVSDLIARDVPLSPNIDPLWVLTNESQAAEWQNEGLPADRISIENGAILSNCSRWPLLIDPQLQGIRWLKKHEELRTQSSGRKVIVIRSGEKGWMVKIVQAIQSGDTVILENVGETLDAALDPVISKSIYRKGKSLYIKIGGENVEYDEEFRFYMQTKLSNPHYKPEISAQCTLINFIVTKKGLEDQLLAVIVSEEEPELEKTKNELVQAFNNYKIQLKNLEDQLLERLANAPSDILSDIPLIEGLEATKEKANDINTAVAKGRVTEVGINQAREVYRFVATEASLLYFVLLQLCSVDHMYQYSLDSFTMFFLKALKTAPYGADKAERVVNLQGTLRWTIFKWVVRGLFEKHRLVFLTQLTLSLIQQNLLGDDVGFSQDGLRFLLIGPRGGEDRSPVSWIPDAMWGGVKNLSVVEGFERLPADIEESAPRFLEWFQHFAPETEKLPGDWRELEKWSFKKLLVVRVLRPDRITAALTSFIVDLIPKGKDYVECDSQLNSYQVLEQSFEDSSPLIPLYFILSPGADVVSDVDKLALKFGKVKGLDYHNISLGQGQDLIAAERLEVGHRQGHWIFLNNVHLMPRWLLVLEKIMDKYAEQGTHPDFRIMFSSDPSPSIPVTILDRSIKITSDPPSGLKANLKQAFACFSKEMIEELEPRTRGILFGLCQFHAVMVERKKFLSKGFNMMYPFSIGDLTCSATVLRNYMESAPTKVPWADLRYLFGEIMYGGHIVDDLDRLLANTYLGFYMREELLDEMPMFPYMDNTPSTAGVEPLRAPSTTHHYEKILEHIEDSLKAETPVAFGLHPNAEIGFRTQISEGLLRIILELSASSQDRGSSGDVQSSQQVAEGVIQDVMETLRDVKFEPEAIAASVEDIGPFQNIIIQECERMNVLIGEIIRSLVELDLGFRGDLTVSEAMEDLANSLFLDRVPKKWELLAYPSLRPLGSWLGDLQNRISQLMEWSANAVEAPVVTWISGLFNPQSFLTAVMQSTAQSNGLELDKLSLLTEPTKKAVAEEMTVAPKDGVYIIGLFLEGGSWNINSSNLEPSKPREMTCPLPVVHIRAAIVDKFEGGIFHCPVYKTQQRGPTFVFSMQLKTKHEPAKWILAGVVAVLDVL